MKIKGAPVSASGQLYPPGALPILLSRSKRSIFFIVKQAVCEEWSEVTEAFYSFFQQLIPRPKWIQWLLISGLSIHIPGL